MPKVQQAVVTEHSQLERKLSSTIKNKTNKQKTILDLFYLYGGEMVSKVTVDPGGRRAL